MPRKKTTEETPVADMFKDLEQVEAPESGPESANQPQLGGKTQKLASPAEVSDIDGAMKPKEVSDLSEGESAELTHRIGGEMDFHTVALDPVNLKYIPGPKKFRLNVLRSWCKKFCQAAWKPLPNGLTWLFAEEEDALAFQRAWNSRTLIEIEQDVTDGAFYDGTN